MHAGNPRELRLEVSRRIKAALVQGRAAAEDLLIKDRHGRRCAERLCFMQDEIIRVLYEFTAKHLYPAENPSEAEHMAIVATGGYGRGVLAAGSDIDLLFLLPYKQTAWGEVRRRDHPLLPVGHRAQGRPCHALDQRVHPPGQGAT